MVVAVVGATGLVGRMMLKLLEERQFPVDRLLAVASVRSVGTRIPFRGNEITVISAAEAIALKPQIALFSAGGSTSLELAPRFAEVGTYVIDNSSAWRKNSEVPLVVPEINLHALQPQHHIIANPNCSTIQMVVALNPLHKKYGIKRLVISTYQSVSGSGQKGVDQLESEAQGINPQNPAYPHPIHRNVIPHGGFFEKDGYTSEEVKLAFETHKIMEAPQIAVTSTVVRVPVTGGHSMSVNVEFERPYELFEVYDVLRKGKGIVVIDQPELDEYPMPLYASGKDEVFVGRIRRDFSVSNGLNMWIVSDNLRKGAATNAVQIAEHLIDNQFVKTA